MKKTMLLGLLLATIGVAQAQTVSADSTSVSLTAIQNAVANLLAKVTTGCDFCEFRYSNNKRLTSNIKKSMPKLYLCKWNNPSNNRLYKSNQPRHHQRLYERDFNPTIGNIGLWKRNRF